MTISFARHQFPPAIIQHAVYMRFTLNYRDVEDLLAERGLDVSHPAKSDRSIFTPKIPSALILTRNAIRAKPKGQDRDCLT